MMHVSIAPIGFLYLFLSGPSEGAKLVGSDPFVETKAIQETRGGILLYISYIIYSQCNRFTDFSYQPSTCFNFLLIHTESLEGCGMSSMSKCFAILPPDGSTPSNLIEV